MKVILPVAGKGERMRPYTNNLPKCLLPVGGKTIIDWIVEDTRQLHPSETIFITGYKAEKMDQFLETRPQWGSTRTVLQGDPQGLGQAISLALPYVEDDEPVLIILGDTLFDADLSIVAGSRNVIPATEPGSPFPNSTIIPPCVIGKNCTIENSTVGPNVTLGDNCVVVSSMLENCIIWKGESVKNQEVTGQIIATEES